MSTKLYVTNLSPEAARDELEFLFVAHGTVRSVAVINQFTTADSKGVAFVEMDSERHGEAAMAALNGTAHRGFALTVSWAVPGRRRGPDSARTSESVDVPGRREEARTATSPSHHGSQPQFRRSGGRGPH